MEFLQTNSTNVSYKFYKKNYNNIETGLSKRLDSIDKSKLLSLIVLCNKSHIEAGNLKFL